jgi:hypothetical protein
MTLYLSLLKYVCDLGQRAALAAAVNNHLALGLIKRELRQNYDYVDFKCINLNF